MIPGMKPRMVNRMLIRRSPPQPRSRKTPRGGRMTARMILMISEAVKGMFADLLTLLSLIFWRGIVGRMVLKM